MLRATAPQSVTGEPRTNAPRLATAGGAIGKAHSKTSSTLRTTRSTVALAQTDLALAKVTHVTQYELSQWETHAAGMIESLVDAKVAQIADDKGSQQDKSMSDIHGRLEKLDIHNTLHYDYMKIQGDDLRGKLAHTNETIDAMGEMIDAQEVEIKKLGGQVNKLMEINWLQMKEVPIVLDARVVEKDPEVDGWGFHVRDPRHINAAYYKAEQERAEQAEEDRRLAEMDRCTRLLAEPSDDDEPSSEDEIHYGADGSVVAIDFKSNRPKCKRLAAIPHVSHIRM